MFSFFKLDKPKIPKAELQQIKDCIALAEKNTSGEIRVFVENYCTTSALDRAAYHFKKLNMHATKQQNGVLIYLALKHKKVAIIGDKGIHQLVPENFWQSELQLLIDHLKQNKNTEGICKVIYSCGQKLKEYFPIESTNNNELSDEVILG